MIGRTHSQQAIPVTFGMKSAVWLSEIRRHIEWLKAICPRVLAGQLSGAIGSMAALGEHALKIAKVTLAKLGLQLIECPFRINTTRIIDFTGTNSSIT
jgi:adenylosuccinate lyase